MPIVQIKKQRHRDVKKHAKSHTACKRLDSRLQALITFLPLLLEPITLLLIFLPLVSRLLPLNRLLSPKAKAGSSIHLD